MINLSEFNAQGVAAFVQSTVNQYVVRPPGSIGSIGVAGFLFDIIGDEEMSLYSNITDSYVEDNTAVEDHIALPPEQFTLRGYVGELVATEQDFINQVLSLSRAITTLAEMGPVFTRQALETYEGIQQAEFNITEAVRQAQSLYAVFTSKGTAAQKQQNAYNYFKSLWASRQLMTVETPYNVLTDMAILAVHAVQSEDSNTYSTFEVTFKKVRKTSTIISAGNVIATAAQAALSNGSQSFGSSLGPGRTEGNWAVPPNNWPPTPMTQNRLDTGRWGNIAAPVVAVGPVPGQEQSISFATAMRPIL